MQELPLVPREHLPGESDAAGLLLSRRGEFIDLLARHRLVDITGAKRADW